MEEGGREGGREGGKEGWREREEGWERGREGGREREGGGRDHTPQLDTNRQNVHTFFLRVMFLHQLLLNPLVHGHVLQLIDGDLVHGLFVVHQSLALLQSLSGTRETEEVVVSEEDSRAVGQGRAFCDTHSVY